MRGLVGEKRIARIDGSGRERHAPGAQPQRDTACTRSSAPIARDQQPDAPRAVRMRRRSPQWRVRTASRSRDRRSRARRVGHPRQVALEPDDAALVQAHGLEQRELHGLFCQLSAHSQTRRFCAGGEFQLGVSILVVEDEQKVANALREGLEGERFDVVVERTGEGAFFRVNTETFDVVLLDLTLPGRDGLEILQALRQRGVKTPVLVLTARDSLQDRVTGLDAGADDYLVKPFAFAELLARIRALVRRGRVAEAPRLAVGDLEMDLVTRKVTRGGRSRRADRARVRAARVSCCATTGRWCRARRWRATSGRRPPARRRSTT